MIENLIEDLKKDEGFSEKSFWDNKQWSWGFGTPAPGKGYKITKIKAEEYLKDQIQRSIEEFNKIFRNHEHKFNSIRKQAFINMLFNIGLTSFLHFSKMLHELYKDEPNWGAVAFHAYDSRWYKQVGERAERIVREIAYGEKIEV